MKSKSFKKIKTIVTHSGKFHADDVFAVAALKILFSNAEIIRTRDYKKISRGDIVLDVGGIYDKRKNRFDHHQLEGAGKRKNSIPYSSLGLVWGKYGKKICGSKDVADYIDKYFVQSIDAVDNGINIAKPITDVHIYDISDMIYAFTPSWDEDKNVNSVFNEALEIAEKILKREILKTKSKLKAKKFVEAAYNKSKDKRIIALNKSYYWYDVIEKLTKPRFVIYPHTFTENHDSKGVGVYPKDGNWHASAVRKNPESFELRKSFPQSWGGKRDDELAKASGVEDSIFCHRNLFLAVAKSKEGAIKLAKKALHSR